MSLAVTYEDTPLTKNAHGHAQPHAIKSAPHARGAHSKASTDASVTAEDSGAAEADGKVAGAGHRCWTGFNSRANNAAAANLMRGCGGIVEKTASLSWKRGSEDERKRRKRRKSPHGTMEPGSRGAPEIFLSFVSPLSSLKTPPPETGVNVSSD